MDEYMEHEGVDFPMSEKDLQKITKTLLAKGKEKGFLTEDEIADRFTTKPGNKVLTLIYEYLEFAPGWLVPENKFGRDRKHAARSSHQLLFSF